MRSSALLRSLLPLTLLLLSLQVLAQDDNFTCPDSDLTTYLVALIDVLYWNGLTTSEELVVSLSESDEGYTLLESLYSSSGYTLLVPTDSAWQQADFYPPSSTLSNQTLAQIFALHVLQGDWEYAELSAGHNVASTFLSMQNEMNLTSTSTSTEGNSTAMQALILQQGTGNTVLVQSEWSNASSWSTKVDNGNDVLNNVVILPIDILLTFPPNMSTALTEYALTNLSAAFDVVGQMEQVERLSNGGFTLFAPVDSAFTSDINDLLSDTSSADSVIGNLYTTNYSLYSPQWTSSGQFILPVSSGESITVSWNNSGSFVTLGDIEANILQSDLTLQNGVMHIIDTVLLSDTAVNSTSASNTETSKTSTSTKIPSSSNSGTTSRSASATTVTATSTSSAGAGASLVGWKLVISSLFGALYLL